MTVFNKLTNKTESKRSEIKLNTIIYVDIDCCLKMAQTATEKIVKRRGNGRLQDLFTFVKSPSHCRKQVNVTHRRRKYVIVAAIKNS